MRVKIISTDLIRRFGKNELDVDSSIGRLWISKNLAIEVGNKIIVEEKQIEVPPVDKMVRGPGESKENLFPTAIIK